MDLTVVKCLQLTYQELNTPADQIVAKEALRERFARAVRVRTEQADLTTEQIMQALLTLRKRAKLPRLRR